MIARILSSTHRDRCLTIFAFVICGIAIFAGLGQLPLLQPDEGRNAEVAREMKESGRWLVPIYNGLAYLDKPALYFKMVALSFSTFGESEASARFVSALFGFALLVLLFVFIRHVYSERTAALTVIVLATTPLYIAFSRLVIFDVPLTFFICAAIFAGYIAEENEGRSRTRWYLIGSFAAGIATLIKGPPGFVIPILVLLIFNRMDRQQGAIKRLFAPSNLLLFLITVCPWVLGVLRSHPDFLYYGIMEESFRRFATSSLRRTGPFYFYLPWIAGGFFAWSVLLPESAWAAWRERAQWTRADRLLIIWSILVVLIYSMLQSKLPGYILPAIIPLGALTARVFSSSFDRSTGRAAGIVLRGTIILALLSLGIAIFLFLYESQPGTFAHVLKIRSTAFQRLTPMFAPASVALLLIALLAGAARWLHNLRVAFAAFLLFPLVLLAVGHDGLKQYADARSSRTLAGLIPILPPHTEIACIECFPTALPFYLKRNVTLLSKDAKELTSNYVLFTLKTVKPWPEVIVPLANRDQWLATRDHAVYLIAEKRGRIKLDSIAAVHHVNVTELIPGWWGALIPKSVER